MEKRSRCSDGGLRNTFALSFKKVNKTNYTIYSSRNNEIKNTFIRQATDNQIFLSVSVTDSHKNAVQVKHDYRGEASGATTKV